MLFPAGSRLTGAGLTAATLLGVLKGADESVTSSVTLQPDNSLLLPVVAGTSYLFDCYLNYEGASTGGNMQFNWTGPELADLTYTATGQNESNAPFAGTTYTLASTNIGCGTTGAGKLQGVTMKGTLTVGADGGTLQLMWAQGSSSATPTIVHASSSLSLIQPAAS